jgi:hypothetical protein
MPPYKTDSNSFQKQKEKPLKKVFLCSILSSTNKQEVSMEVPPDVCERDDRYP